MSTVSVRTGTATPTYAPRLASDPFWESNADRHLTTMQSLAARIGDRDWPGAGHLRTTAALVAGHDEPTRRRLACTPGFRRTVVEILRAAPGGPGPKLERLLVDLLRCVLLSAHDAGDAVHVDLPVPAGGVLVLPGRPGVRLAVPTGRPSVRIDTDGSALTVRAGNELLARIGHCAEGAPRTMAGPSRPTEPTRVPGTEMVLDGTDEWARTLVAEMNDPATFSANGAREIVPVDEPSDRVCGSLGDSLAAMRERWPDLAAEILRNIAVVFPFESPKIVGYSHVLHLGTVFLNVGIGDAAFLEERLVHEASHNQLFLMQHVKLLNDTADSLLRSPLRKDPRPASGVLHASFVSARCLDWCRRSLDRHPSYADRVRFLESATRDGLQTLRSQADLTDAGSALLDDVEQVLEGP